MIIFNYVKQNGDEIEYTPTPPRTYSVRVALETDYDVEVGIVSTWTNSQDAFDDAKYRFADEDFVGLSIVAEGGGRPTVVKWLTKEQLV